MHKAHYCMMNSLWSPNWLNRQEKLIRYFIPFFIQASEEKEVKQRDGRWSVNQPQHNWHATGPIALI
jgi:hypothetical protein